MIAPLKRAPIREEDEERQPQRSPATSAAARSPLQKNSSGEKEESMAKVLHLRSLLRETEQAIPLPPSGERREAPLASSPLRSPRQVKTSFDLHHGSPQKEDTFYSPEREESSLPASPLRQTLPRYESAAKSPVREEAIVVTQLRSLFENGECPSQQLENLPAANRMAATTAPAVARMGLGTGKGMQVETGDVIWAGFLRAEIVIRILEIVLCLISFSVMAAGETRGWDGDSFDRYKEFRYCLSLNVLAFAYAIFQVYAHFYHRIKRRHIICRPLSNYFDFWMDQLLAYLLLSASSTAATQNEEWVAMFGRDKFTNKMGASIAISFLAFLVFATNCIISTYKLFN